MLTAEERSALARAPFSFALIGSGANREFAQVEAMRRRGLLEVEVVEGRAFGDVARVNVWLTVAGARAYAEDAVR